jgi:hypothetical protein
LSLLSGHGSCITLATIYKSEGYIVENYAYNIIEILLLVDYFSVKKNKWSLKINNIMKIDLDVIHSCSIKRKKPWPKISWLGKVKTIKQFLT